MRCGTGVDSNWFTVFQILIEYKQDVTHRFFLTIRVPNHQQRHVVVVTQNRHAIQTQAWVLFHQTDFRSSVTNDLPLAISILFGKR